MPLVTCDTVLMETPARRATSRAVATGPTGRALAKRLRNRFNRSTIDIVVNARRHGRAARPGVVDRPVAVPIPVAAATDSQQAGCMWCRASASCVSRHHSMLRRSPVRGVLLPGGSRVELREFPDPVPGIGQAVLRIKASSICGSDVRAIYREHLGKGAEGYIDGTIGGHEPCGAGGVGRTRRHERSSRRSGRRLSHRRMWALPGLPRRLHDQLHLPRASGVRLATQRRPR